MTQSTWAQDTADLSHVASIDAIVETLYSVISGKKGEPRDWELMRSLFHPEAKAIPTGKRGETYGATYMPIDTLISYQAKAFEKRGFVEREIHREVQQFGHLAHVFTTYEILESASDATPQMRGINSLQLLNDGERWWILNISWMQESPENLIPQEFLPD
ncbi:hypothetical protein [Pontibacter sp. G13]|uniref:hypothetical protein n=1 Tax=Pontibacter sp. G13 TaxID=3074898 RepID=UPI00288958E3|nr:hypothetical protein [Pontibacter sp. G13]WNJ20598.1 hypothetical protein RJD25_08950 [Pontibacter sp. G13]